MNSRIRFFKLLVLSLAIILCVGMLLVSCGDDTEGSGSSDKPSDSTEKSPSTESSKDDSVPSATQSSVSGTTDSSKPGTTDSSNPGTTDSSNPGTTDSSKPGTTDSSNPGTDEPCDHNFVKTSSIPATCKEEGIDTYTCSECGSTKEEKVAKLTEHTYEYTETQPTCQTEGKIIGVCEECGDTIETKGKPKTAHTGHEVILTNPTCTEKGSKDWVCKDCGTSVYKVGFEKEIPALGHSYERTEDMFDEKAGVTFVAGTCSAEGMFARVCTECGYDEDPITREEYGEMAGQLGFDAEKYDKMASFGHNFTVELGSVPATCVTGSYDEFKCEWCDETKKENEGEPLGHTYTLDDSAVEGTHYVINPKPTCIVPGKKIYNCDRCGEAATDGEGVVDLPVIPHDTSNRDSQYLVTSMDATCTTGAYKVYRCCVDPLCKETVTITEGEALGHEWVIDGEPSCITEGKTPYKCNRGDCGATKLDGPVVGEIRHVYKETVIGATCISDAVYKCKECGNEYAPYDDDVEGKAHGEHVLVYSETVAPTCTSDGYKIYKCGLDKNCTVSGKNTDINNLDVPKPEDVVPAIEHQYDEPMADGLLVCYLCNKNYRDVTSEKASENDEFCMGCGKDPCECGATSEWNGYTPAKEPEAITANVEFTKKDVALTDSTAELEIGKGVIRIVGQEGATYTIKLYDEVDGILLDTLEFDGGEDAVYVILEDYDVVGMVQITSTTDALVSFYAQAE